MTKTKKKFDNFKIVLTFIVIIFSSALFLSIPALFNYKSVESEIEKKFYSEFKIHLEILDEVSHQTFPQSHLLIKKGILKINNDKLKSVVVEFDNLKIYTPIKNIYSKSFFEMKEIEINNSNFKIKFNDIKDIRNHLYYKINKPIIIKNSKFFYLDKNNETILISPIKNLKYSINNKNNSKELKIKGSIFDINYKSLWRRYYNNPKKSYNEISLKNPNLFIKNLFEFENNENFEGSSSVDILNEQIILKYKKKGEKILIKSPDVSKNQKIKIFSNIELNPFYFDSKITFIDKDLKFIIDDLLIYTFNIKKEILGNLNGHLTLNFNNIQNQLINSGKIKININEKDLNVKNAFFEINDIGIVDSQFKYFEKEGELIFKSKNVFKIKNLNKFKKKFQLSLKKSTRPKKIFFDLEKNISTGEILLSNIYVDQINPQEKSNDFYKIKNIQVLKSLLRDILPN